MKIIYIESQSTSTKKRSFPTTMEQATALAKSNIYYFSPDLHTKSSLTLEHNKKYWDELNTEIKYWINKENIENISMLNKSKKTIFIAGPKFEDLRYEKIEENIQKAERFTRSIIKNNLNFYCPLFNIPTISKKDEILDLDPLFYDMRDIEILKRTCGAICAIPGWKNSFSARKEIKTAKENRIEIFFIRSPGDLSEAIEWNKNINLKKENLIRFKRG